MTITKKTRLLPPPFVGTRIGIKLTDSLTWGIYSIALAEGSPAVLIDWGDGTRQSYTEVSGLTHEYAASGEYEVRISDDISRVSMNWDNDPMKLAVKSFATNATKLKLLPIDTFAGCANLSALEIAREAALYKVLTRSFEGCVSLPSEIRLYPVTTLAGNVFGGCPQIKTLRFSKANEEAIKALPAWESSGHKFGAENATVSFDL